MKDDYQIRITMSARQANLIAKVLDMYTRMGIGQLEDVAVHLNHLFDTGHHRFDDYNPIGHKMMEIKTGILHQPTNGSHGIASPNVHTDVKTIYDMLKCVEKGIATAEDHGSHSVWHHGDILHLGDQPTPTVDIVRGDEIVPVEVKKHRRGDGK